MKEQNWWKECVVYQIYPRSFCDSNGDGIGDINGITTKLDYLKDLGVDVLWLSPVCKSPNDDNGYDISNYRDIMEEFGTMEDFHRMLEEAHKRGLKIMLDLVVNHTSDEHEWFNQSKRALDGGKYRDYYIWKKGKGENPPNNWGSFFGGSAWEYCEERKEYYLHIFSRKQPDLNWENPAVREEIYDMMQWWLNKGIDGFRMDVINLIGKDQNFPDGIKDGNALYGDLVPYTHNMPQAHIYLKEMNEKVLSKHDVITVGETLNTSVEDGIKYAGFDENELNMIFTFEHMNVDNLGNSKWNDQRFELKKLKEIMTRWQNGMYQKAWNSLYWNNHDQPRVVSRFGNDGAYRELSAKMLATCLHMMQGTPYIYQGEEIGMTNLYFDTIEEYEDIESRTAFEQCTKMEGVDEETMMRRIRWKSRDNARTPMQWNSRENAGFTKGTPWFTVNPNYKSINVEDQQQNEESILNYYKRLIALRKKYRIIVYGDYRLLDPESDKTFTYMRTLDQEKLLVACNFTDAQVRMQIPDELKGTKGRILISNYSHENKMLIAAYGSEGRTGEDGSILLRPYETVVTLF
ncbi:alpha-glucosidase [Clostridium sp. AF19-22AC]|jgi:oligo-1,6-glucosidase|uniref:glycoside hydrolase family 13 protein n=1 Tax=Clostridia TaxID=186801 RepID=UPI000E4E0266|nr:MULTISPECIES: alpha-glucosidase [Clostridia]RHR30789.1 alpha-glucosidase [Clostridium sp. AF19-22AC]